MICVVRLFLLFTVSDISERSQVSSSCANKAHFGKLPSHCSVMSWCYLGAHMIESSIKPGAATALFLWGLREKRSLVLCFCMRILRNTSEKEIL